MIQHHFLKKALLKRFVKDFETNHEFQIKFHLWAMVFWMICGALGPVLLLVTPTLWLKIGVLFVYELSIYANWDTDYGSVSSAQSAQHAQGLLKDKGT